MKEKVRISDLCCTGLYFFSTRDKFDCCYASEVASPSQIIGEHYVAPLYNHLIRTDHKVIYELIANRDVIFCGVPEQYDALATDPRMEELAAAVRS